MALIKIKEYVRILPRFIDRLAINRKLETTYDFLGDVKASLDDFIELRQSGTLPKTLDKFSKGVKGLKRFGKPKKQEPLYIIQEALRIALEGRSVVSEYVKREIVSDIAATAITYKKANILGYISTLNNVGDRLNALIAIVIMDEGKDDISDSALAHSLNDSIESLNTTGFELISVLSKTHDEVIEAFNTAPEILVSEDDSDSSFLNNATVDPMRVGFIPANNANPFFFIGKALIFLEDNWYQWRLENKQLLELRLADLRSKDNGEENPKLQAEIEALENRLAKLKYKIEKSMGGD